MKRIDKIYEYIKENSKELSLENLKNKDGFTAIDISEKLNILRNNVSAELNALLRQGKIIKIKGRPVVYLDREHVEKVLRCNIQETPVEIESIEELITGVEEEQQKEESPFALLIGAESGLKNQIEQAKAAMLYPPNGLHTLIVGQTGVGKTLFATMMYNYAKYAQRLQEKAPFVVFNCADYYNNPQLLISHIFGHAKGAFTGADSEKDGLVEKANGGILFLDEIHRLPPEGQEMIFYFMDTGTYNKLGDSDRKRKSNVLIIGATTEEPGSSLLKTFVRRIPIVINIPSLDERPIKDRLDIVKFLLSNEAHRVNKKIRIEADAVKALMGSVSYGNVGQMKSNVQLVCAKGFLNCIDNKEYIDIDYKSLPPDIKSGLFSITSKRKEAEELSNYIDSQLVVSPEGYISLSQEDSYEPPFNLYKIIEDKAAVLKEEGVDEEYIKKFITTDINIHIKCFYDKFKNSGNDRENILKIVNEDILNFCEEIKALVEKKIDKKLNEKFLYALTLHISAFFKRTEDNIPLRYTNIEDIIEDNNEEYNIALEIKELIEKRYKMEVPEMETIYLTLLISTINDENSDHVAVLVAAHGNRVASDMVNVVKKLLGEGNVDAIDMPLDVSPQEILSKMIEKVKEIDMGKGVLLLVDMGSLANFEGIIEEKTCTRIRTIEMVSTPLVLEAVRKANILDMDLDTIYDSLKSFSGYGHLQIGSTEDEPKDKAIITICSTGQGTAMKLKELVRDIIENITDDKIAIIPVSIRDINGKIAEIGAKYKIIASVGVIKPEIDVPFVSLEHLIGGEGQAVIENVVKNNNLIVKESKNNVVVKEMCLDSLNQFLTFLNPNKIVSVLMNAVSILEKETNRKFNNAMCIRIIVHTACALERMVINDGLVYRDDKNNFDKNIVNAVNMANEMFKKSINVSLSEDEICFVADIIK
ncbi:sigma 54-interacting transcriptional regulator [Clostridium sp. 19966]|uniref:sigma 54-interacting transcriptional regulator n=1 Tax=Clostridium sp. 19966 TaxID=2768166 RepID=UPI0028DDF6BD|nr:sigma 54-interacting transcriptional regulator [Clostridium sp. 19966]MDT8718966.1 sigma 54-interacting transcriptional regulator [Clostridium sp. 19966]